MDSSLPAVSKCETVVPNKQSTEVVNLSLMTVKYIHDIQKRKTAPVRSDFTACPRAILLGLAYASHAILRPM